MNKTFPLLLLLTNLWALTIAGQQKNVLAEQTVVWQPADLILQDGEEIQILGSPKLVDSPYGDAVYFDGEDDAIILNQIPLKGLEEFTVEMIFKPDSGAFEQRFLHIGEASGDRILLELRSVNDQWYFDGFAKSKSNKKALINEQLIHPIGQWYHVAFVVTPNSLKTYVNGNFELYHPFTFSPINKGATSIGTRLDKRSWFKGSIFKIRIKNEALEPNQFMPYSL